MIKKITRILDVALTFVATLGTVAKIRKDLHTHRTHGEHNPCACGEHCLGCLW